MAQHRADGDEPVVLARRHGDGRDLASIAPLAEKGHDERLDPRGAEEEREEVVRAGDEARDAAEGRGGRGRTLGRRRRRAVRGEARVAAGAAADADAGFEGVGRDLRRASRGAPRHRVLLLLELHLHLLHFLAHALAGIHVQPFAEKLDAEEEEEGCGGGVRELLRDEMGDGVAEKSGEHGHGDERGEGGAEDQEPGVSHCHKTGDEEGLVANFGEDDHAEGEERCVEGTDDAVLGFVVGMVMVIVVGMGWEVVIQNGFRGRLFSIGSVGDTRGSGMGNVVGLVGEMCRLLSWC